MNHLVERCSKDRANFETRAVRHGQHSLCEDFHCEPISLTSPYRFVDADQAHRRFSERDHGNVYSRLSNPTVDALGARIAALEHAEEGVMFSSGMSAITALGHAFLTRESNIVCSRDVFGTTKHVFSHYFGKLGVETRFVDPTDNDQWAKAIDKQTAIIFAETPSNTRQTVADIRMIGQCARSNKSVFVVDNTLMTPVLQNPISLGADLVLHSAGKYLDDQGRCVAGAIAGSKLLINPLKEVLRSLGPCLGPVEAWLILKGIETLAIRVMKAQQNTRAIADFLHHSRYVKSIFYSGSQCHPQAELIKKQQFGGGGASLVSKSQEIEMPPGLSFTILNLFLGPRASETLER
ncbi:MAG: PLP-dependent transferase [Acetobacteraceae bacterium]